MMAEIYPQVKLLLAEVKVLAKEKRGLLGYATVMEQPTNLLAISRQPY